ncbi:MAG: SGNH/GDSL hydrolase family protein [Gammaproteobacteria bacterium]|nr:SGNH/GDSL hydrolase family protein [Gammaproteobacteria bacterium]
MNIKSHRAMVLLITVLWSLSGSGRASFTDMVVIGDSLSDQGNVYLLTSGLIPPPEYTDGTNVGRFTNGLNYIDYLSASLNLDVKPSLLPGGSNYATGGARTDSASIGGIPLGPFSLLNQRDNYLSNLDPSGIDPGALHVVWGGSNDLSDIIDAIVANPSYDPLPALEQTLIDVVDIIDSLAAADARSILVPNVPNLGLVPLITGGGSPVDEATLLSAMFNTGLADAIDGLAALYPDTTLFEFDAFGLLTDAYFDPDSEFTNVTEGCYSLLVLPGGTTCPNPSEYLSWDGFHPTTRAHELLAANVVVPLPAAVWLFGSGVFGLLVFARRKT